jgi:twitching motility protein PilT
VSAGERREGPLELERRAGVERRQPSPDEVFNTFAGVERRSAPDRREKAVPVGAQESHGTGTNRIDRFLSILPKRSASDLHLAVGSPPILRLDGELERIRFRALTEGDYYNLVGPITPARLWTAFEQTGDVDFAYQMGEQARFRVNLFRQERGSAAVFRLIPSKVPTVEELALPASIAALSDAPSGLILVTGPTGSGKSTTLAAILNRVNQELAYHVITIEDPIEFVHPNLRSVFTQREIGPDVANFAEGVKAAIRQDPDCLLVGEMRDLETMRMALTAAETGLLVFATLHTNSAAKAIDRIIDAFPANEQEQIRIVLAENLRAVVAQQLLRKKGKGRIPAFEILLGSTALSNSIREGKTSLINNQIQTGKSRGMISMDQSLGELVRGGVVEPDEALERAIDRETFKALIASVSAAAAAPPASPRPVASR